MVGEKLQAGPQSVTSEFNVEKLWSGALKKLKLSLLVALEFQAFKALARIYPTFLSCHKFNILNNGRMNQSLQRPKSLMPFMFPQPDGKETKH